MTEESVDELMNDIGLDEDVGGDWAAALQEQSEAVGEAVGTKIKGADLEDFGRGGGVSDDTPDLDAILNIPVTLAMEIGRTKITIRNLLQLNPGSVVELDRLAGEPLDVLCNGTLIAHGEVVVVNDQFGIRLTDVISAPERVKKLR